MLGVWVFNLLVAGLKAGFGEMQRGRNNQIQPQQLRHNLPSQHRPNQIHPQQELQHPRHHPNTRQRQEVLPYINDHSHVY